MSKRHALASSRPSPLNCVAMANNDEIRVAAAQTPCLKGEKPKT